MPYVVLVDMISFYRRHGRREAGDKNEEERIRSKKWHVHREQETALVCMKSLMKSL